MRDGCFDNVEIRMKLKHEGATVFCVASGRVRKRGGCISCWETWSEGSKASVLWLNTLQTLQTNMGACDANHRLKPCFDLAVKLIRTKAPFAQASRQQTGGESQKRRLLPQLWALLLSAAFRRRRRA